MRRVLACLLPLLALGCPKSGAVAVPAVVVLGPPRAYQLLPESSEREFMQRSEKRADLTVSSDSGEQTPVIIAENRIGPLRRDGGRARLYGDEAGTLGWSVDNFVLLEIGDAQGKVVERVAVGFQSGVEQGAERIDTLGPMQFVFGPGEVDLSRVLPANEPFTLKATALDSGGVGRVSELWLVITPDPGGGREEDERWDQ